jgi:flagellar basal-body rod protein FlgB
MKLDMFRELTPTQSMLDFHAKRQSVLAANLANAETPGYVPHDLVAAEPAGSATLQTTDAGHIATVGDGSATPVIELEAPRVDGNGVQIEQAMAAVTANRIRYEAGIEVARRQVALLRYAATDGGNG